MWDLSVREYSSKVSKLCSHRWVISFLLSLTKLHVSFLARARVVFTVVFDDTTERYLAVSSSNNMPVCKSRSRVESTNRIQPQQRSARCNSRPFSIQGSLSTCSGFLSFTFPHRMSKRPSEKTKLSNSWFTSSRIWKSL